MTLCSVFPTAVLRRARRSLPALALFAACCAPLHAADAVPGPEMQKAFGEFTSFLNEAFTRIGRSGIGDFAQLETKLPEAKKRCDALIATAKDRKDIADAATLTLEAFRYVAANFARPKAERKAPENKILADILARNKAGPTEGQMMKCYQIALVRLTKHFGKPSLTEEQVMAREDIDFGSPALPGHPPAPEAGRAEQFDESSVTVAADGSVTLNERPLPKKDLLAAFKKLKAAAEAQGQDVFLSLYAAKAAKYEVVTEILDAAAKAGVKNITFVVADPEAEP